MGKFHGKERDKKMKRLLVSTLFIYMICPNLLISSPNPHKEFFCANYTPDPAYYPEEYSFQMGYRDLDDLDLCIKWYSYRDLKNEIAIQSLYNTNQIIC